MLNRPKNFYKLVFKSSLINILLFRSHVAILTSLYNNSQECLEVLETTVNCLVCFTFTRSYRKVSDNLESSFFLYELLKTIYLSICF